MDIMAVLFFIILIVCIVIGFIFIIAAALSNEGNEPLSIAGLWIVLLGMMEMLIIVLCSIA